MSLKDSIEARARGVNIAHKCIRLREQHPRIAAKIQKDFNLSPIVARVLAARGYQSDAVLEHYIKPTLSRGLPKPSSLKNLDLACDVVKEVVDGGGSIAICCDFDVDGLSGGSQLAHFFKAINVSAKVFVPDRFKDGYGLNEGIVKEVAEEGFALLIAIDFGTTNISEFKLAKELGLKTIVVDHHHVGDEVPDVDVFINPHQAGCGFAEGLLCAAGLAWYLIVGLRRALSQAEDVEPKAYLDLACLGTICDMVPLVGANRILAKRGLEALEQTERKGLRALKEVVGVRRDVRCSHVSFGMGPRLNAAGRMLSGQMVVELLTTDSGSTASKIAKKLNKLNLSRQETEENVKAQAMAEVKKLGFVPAGLVVWGNDFHTGVIGIVAQRLVENYYRPSIVLGYENGVYKGSMRGIKDFNVIETLESLNQHLIKYGGHEGAAGLSIEKAKLDDFRAAFVKECERRLEHIETQPHAKADTEIEIADIDLNLIIELKKFEPFGVGNPGPLVLIRDLEVKDTRVLKNAHLKTTLSDGRRSIAGMLWKQTSHPALKVGSRVNIVCKPDMNTYGGRTEMQAILQAVERAE